MGKGLGFSPRAAMTLYADDIDQGFMVVRGWALGGWRVLPPQRVAMAGRALDVVGIVMGGIDNRRICSRSCEQSNYARY